MPGDRPRRLGQEPGGPHRRPSTGGAGRASISYPTPASGNPSLVGDDTGREITSITIGGTAPSPSGSSTYTADFPNGLFVGTVSDTGELYPTNSGGPTVAASFQVIDDAGNPVDHRRAAVTSVTLSAEGDPALLSSLSTPTAPVTADPLFDATDPTTGGGDTGSVLISPYIKPGTVSTTVLQPLQLAADHGGPVRRVQLRGNVRRDVYPPDRDSVCGGLDGAGPHRLRRPDRTRRRSGATCSPRRAGNGFLPPLPTNPGEGLPEAPLAVAFPALGLLLLGGYLVVRRRRNPADRRMTTVVAPTADAPTDRAQRPGSSGVRRVLFWAVVVVPGGHAGLGHLRAGDDAGPQHGRSAVVAPQATARPSDRPDRGRARWPTRLSRWRATPYRSRRRRFSALAVVNGPVVPGEGLPVIQGFTTCTWTISLSHVRGHRSPQRGRLRLIDHQQTVYKPALVPGEAPLPATLRTGQSLSFKIRAVMPIGEGLMRWAPDGDHIVAKWDCQVEDDGRPGPLGLCGEPPRRPTRPAGATPTRRRGRSGVRSRTRR